MNQNLIGGAIQKVMPQVLTTGLLRSLLSVSAPDTTLSNTGAPTGTFVAVAGLQNLVCQDAPGSTDRVISEEKRNQYENASIEVRHILLGAYYSQLSPDTNWGTVGWRAAVDGTTYDIIAAESDSQRTQTRLRLRRVTL